MCFYKNKLWVLYVGISIIIASCGNNSTGPDPEEAPELPQVINEEAQPDVSFFENNEPKIKQDTSNYYDARFSAIGNSGVFTLSEFYSALVMSASGEEPDYNDGVWEWEYSYNYEGSGLEMLMTAEESEDAVHWQLYWSYDDGEGNRIDNYKVLEGNSKRDGSEGEWLFNTLESNDEGEIPALRSVWEVLNDEEKAMTVETYDEAGNVTTVANYEANRPEHRMTFTYPNSTASEVEIFWNTETNRGYLRQGTMEQCWDETFANTACD